MMIYARPRIFENKDDVLGRRLCGINDLQEGEGEIGLRCREPPKAKGLPLCRFQVVQQLIE